MHYQELYFKQYPLGTMQDYIKYIYQATLGSAHLVANQEDNYQYLIKEYETIEYDEEHILFEEISEELVRVHLEAIPKAYLAYYHHFFMLSVDVKEDKQKLIDALLHAEDIPFSKEEWNAYVEEYIQKGCPVMRHSEIFRKHYHPHYRLMKKEYIPYIQLLDKEGLLAIDGHSASGKSTLAKLLSEAKGYPVISMDEFFLQPHQRTEQRSAEIGGNIDYERFYQEVVLNIKQTMITYQIFDCSCMRLTDKKTIDISKGLIIEGCYSHHPYFKEYMDHKVFLSINRETQIARILKRNGEKMLQRFVNEWIPKEDLYFETFQIKEKANIIL